MLSEDLVVDSFAFEIPINSESGSPRLLLAKNRDLLRVNSGMAGASALLARIERFEGAQRNTKKPELWELNNSIVSVKTRSAGGAGEEVVWCGAVGVSFVKVTELLDSNRFKHFDIRFKEAIEGAESEVVELRVKCRVPPVSMDKNRELVFCGESDDCDVTVLYKFLQDRSFNFCESQLTIETIDDSVEGAFKAVEAAKTSDRSLNLYECMEVLRVLRNRIFGHAQFRIAKVNYDKASAVLEYLASTLEGYFAGLLVDEARPYFGARGAFRELCQEKHDDVQAAARRVRASLANNVSSDAAMESSLDGSNEDFISAVQRNFSASDFYDIESADSLSAPTRNEADARMDIRIASDNSGADEVKGEARQQSLAALQTEPPTSTPAALPSTLPEYVRILREALHITEGVAKSSSEVVEQAAAWITDGDSAEQYSAQRGLVRQAQFLVSEALPVFLHRVAAVRSHITLRDEAAGPEAVIQYAVEELLGDDHGASILSAKDESLLRKVTYLLSEVLGVDVDGGEELLPRRGEAK